VTTCENYGVYSHQQIRHEMYDGAGPASQGAAMAGWHELADRLDTIRHYLDSAIGGVLASRQGVAADAAVGSMIPLGTWLDEVQRLANDTRDRIDHQIAGFIKARDSIPEVPPEPRGADWQEYAVIDLVTVSDQEADEAVIAERQRQARAAMMLYQDTTNERIGGVVHFAPPPAGAPDLTLPTGHRPGVGALPGEAGGAPGGAGRAEPGAPTSAPGIQGDAPGALSGPQPAPTGAQASTLPVGPELFAGRSLPAAPPPPGSTGSAGIDPYPVGIGPHGSGRTPIGQIGLGNPGRVRGRPASGGFGPREGRRPGSGGIGPERDAGPSGSAGPPPARGRGVSGADRLGNAGTPGAMPPFAGTSGRCEEDHERRRLSYLLEPESNRLVGTLPPAAPAVIGDDSPNDDEPTGP